MASLTNAACAKTVSRSLAPAGAGFPASRRRCGPVGGRTRRASARPIRCGLRPTRHTFGAQSAKGINAQSRFWVPLLVFIRSCSMSYGVTTCPDWDHTPAAGQPISGASFCALKRQVAVGRQAAPQLRAGCPGVAAQTHVLTYTSLQRSAHAAQQLQAWPTPPLRQAFLAPCPT